MDENNQNISMYRINKMRELIIFSYIISILMTGLMFKDFFVYTYTHIFPFNFFWILNFFVIIFIITKFLSKKKVFTIPSVNVYLRFFLFVTLFTYLIYINTTIQTNFLKIYYLIPIIISTVSYGRKMGFSVSAYSSFNLLYISYFSQNYAQFDFDILIIILFFWMVWLIGGFIDLERNIQTHLKKIIAKEKKLKQEKEINLRKLENLTRKLKESQKLFKLNFEKASIGIAICDIDDNFVKINSSLASILDYNKENLENMNCKDMIFNKDQAKYEKEYKQLLKGNKDTIISEKRMVNKDNNIVWVRENTTLARDEEGKPQYFLHHIEDITERKRAERQIKIQKEKLEYNKIKTKFFAKVSHELKTPLNLIFTSLHMLLKNSSENEKSYRFLKIIKQNSYRLLRLVNNVIDLTKMDLNDFQLNKINIDIVEAIKNITDSTREYVKSKNRKIIFNSHLKKQVIACDPFNIERIILNLISNAVKFTEPGDQIIVDISKKTSNILISVRDTGIGMKEKHMKIIFEQFRQVDESFSKNVEGSGIGLSIVKSLVELHDGRIWVESEYNKGSTFFIELPIQIIDETRNSFNKQKINTNLIDKVNVEFSDIYSL